MHPYYDDIISRIGERPIWYDENAVPRYCEFEPDRSAYIYTQEVALGEITCQGCSARFLVAFSAGNVQEQTIAEAIKSKTLHYGDPPAHGRDGDIHYSCSAGDSMNSEPRKVVEYWRFLYPPTPRRTDVLAALFTEERDPNHVAQDPSDFFKWKRDTSLEVDIKPDWVRNL